MHGDELIYVPPFFQIPTFAQTMTARTFINPSFLSILTISRIQLAQASNDRHAQGFPETTFLTPSPLPSEISHIANA
jgi:hypothetical protein